MAKIICSMYINIDKKTKLANATESQIKTFISSQKTISNQRAKQTELQEMSRK